MSALSSSSSSPVPNPALAGLAAEGSEQRLRAAGLKAGITQRRILEVMTRVAPIEGRQTPEAVHALLQQEGVRCALSSVYRAMTHMAQAGVLERHDVPGGSVVFTRPGAQPRTAYLVCQACDRVLGVHDTTPSGPS